MNFNFRKKEITTILKAKNNKNKKLRFQKYNLHINKFLSYLNLLIEA